METMKVGINQQICNKLVSSGVKEIEGYPKWKDGPLYWNNCNHEFIRKFDINVTLKYLHDSQNVVDEISNKVTNLNNILKVYGISQNPDTNNYIMVLEEEYKKYCIKCDKIYTNIYYKWCRPCEMNIVLEWIPYSQLVEIEEIGDRIFSAKWTNGPLGWKVKKYIREPNKKVVFKYLDLSITDESLIEYKNDLLKSGIKIYGISQNLNKYIMILQDEHCKQCGNLYTDRCNKWCKECQINYLKENFTNWNSRNNGIDKLIQEMQLKIDKYDDIIFEWVPYNQFNDIKEIDKNSSTNVVYSAKWRDGPLCYNVDKNKYVRDLNKTIILKCSYNSQNDDKFLDEIRKCLNNDFKIYGITQNPNTKDYIMIFHNKYFEKEFKNYCEICNTRYSNSISKWCKPCQIKYLESNFTSWTSGNKNIDDFIQTMQLRITTPYDKIFEWISYNQFDNFKEINNDEFSTISSAIWKKGLLYWNNNNKKYIRKLFIEVTLKCLHNLQNDIEFLNEVKLYLKDDITNITIHGISQNPDTKEYIMVFHNEYCAKCGELYTNTTLKWSKWKDGPLCWNKDNRKYKRKLYTTVILKCLHTDNSNILYEAKIISEINSEIYGITQKPDTKDYIVVLQNECKEYIRKSDIKVTLECLKYTTNEFLNKIEMYLKNDYNGVYTEFTIYGISQNPNTKDYIVAFREECCVKCNKIYTNTWNKWCKPCQKVYLKNNFTNWTSKNKNTDKLIQEMQLKINDPYDIIFEWIPYNQLSDIKEINKSNFATIYTSIWKDGPLYWNGMMYKRDSSKPVTLKCLNSLQSNTGEFLSNEIKRYSINSYNNIYGISQNANYYVIVLQDNYYKNHCLKCNEIYTNIFYKWCKPCQMKGIASFISGNEKIDSCIQEMQLRNNGDLWDNDSWDKVFEWIPYNQFHDIKPVNKDDFFIVYSAKWINGPLYYNISKNKYMRSSEKSVALICFLQNFTSENELLNEVETCLFNLYGILEVYGISQNPVTKEYLIVNILTENRLKKNFKEWTSGCKKIDDFIQNMQSKINDLSDIVFEWIPYEQFDDIREIDKGGFSTVYSAIWKKGPLFYNLSKKNYTRNARKMVALKCIYNSQSITNELVREIKGYSIGKYNGNILKIYGLSQNPSTKEYIIILEYAVGGNFNKWVSKNWDNFSWLLKINTLLNISNGLKKIHQKKAIHRDLHTGNILFFIKNINAFSNSIISISDMGLCGEVTLDICRGNRPKINESEAPKCYIDLMKKCWDPNPDIRKDSSETYDLILKFRKLYVGGVFTTDTYDNEIEIQFKKAEEYRKANLSMSNRNNQSHIHSQAIDLQKYTDCLDCSI
ncbi:kinase-like domain-containing protein [Rhizophagus clarus]|uniref:Kinase-like domain-containing protein n=1 Tax=Rhizophagus clarus TaxID=94130 RepID=A0A8H3QE87_9GLOM|nr:kinase-like domain-containing protein [Rhizophagus clarus]